MAASICWVAAEADTQFAIFALFALKIQCLIFDRFGGSPLVNSKDGIDFVMLFTLWSSLSATP
jgi:hypothetical protein